MTNLKSYILRGVIAVILSIVLVVGIYIFLQLQLASPNKTLLENEETPVPSQKEQAALNLMDSITTSGGVPLSEFSLPSAHERLIEKAGIDTDALEITPSMLECGEETVGRERLAEIIAGGFVGYSEADSILKCLEQ